MLRYLLAIVGGLSVAAAQTTQGTISGLIYDRATGSVIENATVSATNLGSSEVRTANSGAGGFYAIPLLSPGRYSVRGAKDGYQSVETYNIELQVSGRTLLDLPLRSLTDVYGQGAYQQAFVPGSQSIVHVYAADIQTTRSEPLQVLPGDANALHTTVSYVVDTRAIDALPLFGRDVYTLLVLFPGVTADNATSRGLGISVNGQRASSSNFLLDGQDNNNHLLSGPLMTIAPEAVQEYRISTHNFSAEYGRTSGFIANAVTISGSSRWHGLGYLYLKNDVLNANDFQRNVRGDPRNPVKELQPGFSLGGPLHRTTLFGSFAFEHLRFRSFRDSTQVLLPSRLFQPAPGSRAEAILSRIQRPATPEVATPVAEVEVRPTSSLDRTLALARIDKLLQYANSRVFGRAAFAGVRRPDLFWTPYKDFVAPLDQNVVSFGGSWIAAPRPDLNLETRLGWSSDDLSFERQRPEVPLLQSLDGVLLPGSRMLFDYANRPTNREVATNVIRLQGRHMLKFGGGLLIRSLTNRLTLGRDRYIFFPSLQDFGNDRVAFGALGVARDALPALAPPQYDRRYRNTQFFLFAQDSFRHGRRLVIDYGIRYENFGVVRNVGSRADLLLRLGDGSSLPERLTSARLISSDETNGRLYDRDNNNFAGRLGLAFALSADGRSRIRSSYGIFYDRPFDNFWQTIPANSTGFLTFTATTATPDYLGAFSTLTRAFDTAELNRNFSRVTFVQPGLRTGYVHSAFAGVQHDITGSTVVELNLAASLSRKLLTTDAVNRQNSVTATPPVNPLGFYNPDLSLMYYRANQGAGNYWGVSGVVRHRSSLAVLQASYTLSHAIDNQSEPIAGELFDFDFTRPLAPSRNSFATFTRQFDSGADRGNSDFEQRHNFVVMSVLSPPPLARGSSAEWLLRDWMVGLLAAFRSGFPFSVLGGGSGGPASGGQLFLNRADVIAPGDTNTDLDVPGGRLVLNRDAFRAPSGAQLGTSGRNAFRGPGFYNFDLSVSRSISVAAVSESARVILRADLFNVLNHANLGSPDPVLGSPGFGQASYGRTGISTGFPALIPLNETARQVQLLLRFTF